MQKCRTTHIVENYTICLRLHTFFVKLHSLCNIKSVSFPSTLTNFTLDWIFLHNQQLWWLWQISGVIRTNNMIINASNKMVHIETVPQMNQQRTNQNIIPSVVARRQFLILVYKIISKSIENIMMQDNRNILMMLHLKSFFTYNLCKPWPKLSFLNYLSKLLGPWLPNLCIQNF